MLFPAITALGLACSGPGEAILGREPALPAGYVPRPEGTITFSEHIAPIVHANCSVCHRPGEAAPFSLLTYDHVRKRARQMAEVTSDRFMPPWLPQPGYGRFEGERRLGDEELGLLIQWTREGAAPGDLERTPAAPEFTTGWSLGEPDLVVTMPAPYELAAMTEDVFRNFVLPVPLDETVFVRSIEFRPDNLRVMHHATIAVDRTPSSRYRDRLDDMPGFDGMINTNAVRPDGHLLGWVPGKLPFEGREDIAWRLDPGSDLVVQLHMQPSGKPEQVGPSIGLYFSEQPPTQTPFLLRLGSLVMDIPAGRADYSISDTYVLPVDVEVLGLAPHAHYLGRAMEVHALLPDGRRVELLRIAEWDFNWQDEYRFSQPVFLPKGSALTMHFTYDNTAENVRNPNNPPLRMRYGPKTYDEMGDLWLQALPRTDDDLEILRRDFNARELRARVAGCRKYLEHQPDDLPTRHDMAEMLQAQGNLDEAIEQFRRVIESDAEYALAHSRLGSALKIRGELEQAVEHYRTAIRLEPDLPELHFNLGQALKLQGKLDEAIVEFERSLELRPGMAQSHFVLGNARMAQQRPDLAVGHFQQAIRLDPANFEAHNNLGTVLGTQGRLAEAAAEFRLALTIRPDHAKSHFNLGMALAQQGRLVDAIVQFRRTLELEPDHARARRGLELALQQSP